MLAALRMAARMHQNMQLETQKLKKYVEGTLQKGGLRHPIRYALSLEY